MKNHFLNENRENNPISVGFMDKTTYSFEYDFEKWGYEFTRITLKPEELLALPGIYVLWAFRRDGWSVAEVGEAENLREFLAREEHMKLMWTKYVGTIHYTVTYTPEIKASERKRIERKIRKAAYSKT